MLASFQVLFSLETVIELLAYGINRSIGKADDVVTTQSFIDFFVDKKYTSDYAVTLLQVAGHILA